MHDTRGMVNATRQTGRSGACAGKAVATDLPAKYVEPYVHSCGATYDRITLPEAPKRFKLNICYKCYHILADANGDGHAFYYQAAELADQAGSQVLQC